MESAPHADPQDTTADASARARREGLRRAAEGRRERLNLEGRAEAPGLHLPRRREVRAQPPVEGLVVLQGRHLRAHLRDERLARERRLDALRQELHLRDNILSSAENR